jgi:sensor domain CHASE-containing protein
MTVMCEHIEIVRRSGIYTYVGIDFIVVIDTVKVLQYTETCTDRRTASTLQLENQKN